MLKTRFVKTMVMATAAAVALAAAPRAWGSGNSFRPQTERTDGSGPSSEMALYVDGSNGSDNGACQTRWSACRTIQAAVDRIPMVLEQNVTVHIAAGTYRGGVVLADRSSRGNHRIRMLGEAGRTLVSGSNLQETGITIRRTSGVVLEGLAIQEFTRSGIGTHYAGPVSLISSRVSKNGEDGILSRLSDVIVRDSIIEGNGSAGVFCEQGWLSLGASASGRGVAILDNGGDGIRVTGCQARFEGPAIISGNRRGLVAEHGGEIALMLRSDVGILGNAVQGGSGGGSGGEPPPGGPVPPRPVPLAAQMQCQLVADCHGMISSYGNAAVGGGCACEAIGFGICRPD